MADEPSTRMTAFGDILRGWRERAKRPPSDEATESVDALLPEGPAFRGYLWQFFMLMVLASGIAGYGLLADSAAVVIGAMLVAPLMTPITAVAAATVMARNARLIRSLLVIAFGMVTAIAVGYVLAWLSGLAVTAPSELPGEVLARTAPGLLDLGIAVTAGAAAGYIVPRRSTLGALPGVGIAVALVPPLVTVGICLEVGAGAQAGGALLLFGTNLAAIVFAAAVMLIFVGFRPSTGAGSLTRRLIITLVAVIAVAIPLALHTSAAIKQQTLVRAVTAAVAEWDGDVRIVDLNAALAGDGATVTLAVSGPHDPDPAWELAAAIQRRTGSPVDLHLQYQRDDLFQVSVR